MSSNISVPAGSSNMCREGSQPDRGRARGRSGGLGGRTADPAWLFAAVGRPPDRPIADLSADERGRRRRLRRQRLVASGPAVGGAEHHLAVDWSFRVMADLEEKRIVDLSHVIEEGMTTYKGLPGPQLCDFWTREDSGKNYDDGSSFQIGRIDMVANTGTYLDSPFHRYAEGADLAELPLPSLADLPGIMVRRPWENSITIDADAFEGRDVQGKAVLVQTGWDRHWRSD